MITWYPLYFPLLPQMRQICTIWLPIFLKLINIWLLWGSLLSQMWLNLATSLKLTKEEYAREIYMCVTTLQKKLFSQKKYIFTAPWIFFEIIRDRGFHIFLLNMIAGHTMFLIQSLYYTSFLTHHVWSKEVVNAAGPNLCHDWNYLRSLRKEVLWSLNFQCYEQW